MYQLTYEGLLLHDPRSDTLQIREPDVHLAVGEAGSMSFTIDPDHPNAARLTRLRGVVTLAAEGRSIFRGRIRKDARGMYMSREIEVEGLMACLNDSQVPPFNFPDDFPDASNAENIVKYFLGWVLDQHNSQVGPAQQVRLGTVTVSDPNNYISRSSSSYLTAMEVVKKKLVDLLGGYLVPDYRGETTVLHYYSELPLTNLQEVTFGENLLDLVSEIEAADTYTAILPVGKEGLTLSALPDGELAPGVHKFGAIIYSEEAEAAAGGRITRKVEWSDVTEVTNLQTKAVAELTGNGVKHVQSITVKAADLGGGDVARFMVGQNVKLSSPPHGFAGFYPLMELNPDINDPGKTTITLGATVAASSDITHGNQSAAEERADQLQLEVNQQKGSLASMTEYTRQQITEVVQTCEALVLSALDEYVAKGTYEEFRQTVESEFTIMANEISLKFTETTDHIVDVDGELQRTLETLSKHFDFSADGLVIRAGENSFTLTLDNDVISFRKNGQQFGWWDGVDFHTGNIVIDVQERAQFGNFAFVPRSNGSLSLLKVGN